ncbi:MAG: hypothetical protein JNJ88_01735 [Planctomycetes bacterium]|nr:hypothetical protein [Planctomycetota bacterium]
MHAAETESDCDATDITQIQTWINGSAYDVRGDLDLDGDVDTTDKSTAQGSFQGITLGTQSLSASGVGNRRGYTGHELDSSTSGTWHARSRVFGSSAGRWFSRDPLVQPSGLDLYAYCSNRSVVAIDPSGQVMQAVQSGTSSGPATRPTSQPAIEGVDKWGSGASSKGNCWRYAIGDPAEGTEDKFARPPGFDETKDCQDNCTLVNNAIKKSKFACSPAVPNKSGQCPSECHIIEMICKDVNFGPPNGYKAYWHFYREFGGGLLGEKFGEEAPKEYKDETYDSK